jgi:hypothetical protein
MTGRERLSSTPLPSSYQGETGWDYGVIMPAITASQTGSGPLVDRGPDLAYDSKSVSSLSRP